jgi:hypothetical protein
MPNNFHSGLVLIDSLIYKNAFTSVSIWVNNVSVLTHRGVDEAALLVTVVFR